MGPTHLRRGALLVCVLAAALGAVVGLWPGADALDDSTTGEAPDVSLPPPARYAFRYEGVQDLLLDATGAEETFAGETLLGGTLVLTPLGSRKTALTFERLDEAIVTIDGQPLLGEEEITALLQSAMVFERGGDGRLIRLLVDDDTPALVQQLSRQLVLEIALTDRDGTFTVEERAPFGLARSRYQRRAGTLTRTRRAYTELTAPIHDPTARSIEGELRATLVDGVIRTLDGRERIQCPGMEVMTRISLSHEGTAPRPTVDLAGRTSVDASEPLASDRLAAQHLEQRVDGLTAADMVDIVARYGNAPSVPHHHDFLWRATGLLRMRPETARSLRPVFLDAQSNVHTRGLVLDLLVQSRTPEAERVLVELLGSDVATADSALGDYLQRLSFVPTPAPETEALLRARFDEPRATRAAAYAMGGMALQLEATDLARSDGLVQSLRASLEQADTTERPHRIRALGNARRVDDVPRFARLADGADRSTRVAVADVLAKIDAPESRNALETMLDDADPTVQTRALASLGRQSLEPAHLARLQTRVVQESLPLQAYGELLGLLSDQAEHHPQAALSCVEAMASRPVADAAMRTRMFTLLQRLRQAS